MPRKRSKKKTDFNQYLPLLLIGALVVAFVFLGAGPTGKFGTAGGIITYTADDCHSPNSLLLSEGSQPPINCCYNYMGDELWCVGDELPREESPPPGQECAPTGDCDEDGYTILDGDCNDLDPFVSPADNDGDGYSTCDGDCNDNDASLSPADNDGDGLSTCDGDCNDDGTSITVPVGSVFITSDKHNGDFEGTSGADEICGCSAEKGQLKGNWISMIAEVGYVPDASGGFVPGSGIMRNVYDSIYSALRDPTTWVVSKKVYNLNGDIIDERTSVKVIKPNGNFYYDIGTPMLRGAGTNLSNPVRYDEYGIEVPTSARDFVVPVWTGAKRNGFNLEPDYTDVWVYKNCNDWTSSSAADSGGIGDGGIKLSEEYPQNPIDQQIMWGSLDCNEEAHLYCIRKS